MSHTYIYINILPLFPQKNSRTSDQRIAMSLPSAQTVVLKYHFPPEGTRQGFWEQWLIPSLGQNEYGRTWDILSYQRARKLSKTVVLVKGTWETSWRPYSPSGYYLSFKKRTRIAINCNPCVNPCIHNDTIKKKKKGTLHPLWRTGNQFIILKTGKVKGKNQALILPCVNATLE